MRVLHVRHDGDSAGPEARVVCCTGHLLGKFRAEAAIDCRDIHTNFFEHPPTHDAHFTAAGVAAIVGWPAPRLPLETARRPVRQRAGVFPFEGLKLGTNPIPQLLKPNASQLSSIGWAQARSPSPSDTPLDLLNVVTIHVILVAKRRLPSP